MLDKIRKKHHYTYYIVKYNLTLIGSSLFLFCFLFLLYTVSSYNGIFYYGQRYCLADAYIWFLMPRSYGILVTPFLIIIFINLTKYDEMPSILIRLETIENWIKREIIIAALLSFVTAIIVILVVTIITSLQVTTIINWDKNQSVYYVMTHHTNEQVQIEQVLLVAFITILIRNFFLCLSTIFLTIKFHNNILTFIIIMLITIYEMIQKKIHLFYYYITLDYTLWESPKTAVLYIIYCLFAVFFLSVVIKRYSKKKEWLNEE